MFNIVAYDEPISELLDLFLHQYLHPRYVAGDLTVCPWQKTAPCFTGESSTHGAAPVLFGGSFLGGRDELIDQHLGFCRNNNLDFFMYINLRKQHNLIRIIMDNL